VAVALALCALLCLIEGTEALSVTAARAARSQRTAAAGAAGAAGSLALCTAVVCGLLVLTPGHLLQPVGSAVALLAGVQWTVRAALRLIGSAPPAARAEDTPVFGKVLGAGGEVLTVSASLTAAAAGSRSPLWWWPPAAVVLLLVTASWGLVLRRPVPALPERLPKAVLGAALTAAGAVGTVHAGLPPLPWALALVLVAAVMAVVLPHRAGPAPRSATSGLRGFLVGDSAATWAAAGCFALCGRLVPPAGAAGLLAALLALSLLLATRPTTPSRGAVPAPAVPRSPSDPEDSP
jgi:hypothetical protein